MKNILILLCKGKVIILMLIILIFSLSTAYGNPGNAIIDSIIFEDNGEYYEVDLDEWAKAYRAGEGDHLYDKFSPPAEIIGLRSKDRYIDMDDYAKKYRDNPETALEEAADLDPDLVGDIKHYPPKLEVIEVSSVNTTGVTVNFTELEDDLDDANVSVINPADEVVETEAKDLAAGETSAVFDFVEELDEVMYGLWTVDGVEFLEDPTEEEALADLKENTSMELISEDNVVTAEISYPNKIYKELDGFTVDALIEVKKGNVLKDGTRIEIKYNDDKVGVVEVNDNWDDFDERAIYLSKLIAEAEPDDTIFKPFAAFDDTTRACILAHEGREDTWELAIEPSDPKLSDIKVTSQVSKDWNDPFDIATDETRVEFDVPQRVIVEDADALDWALDNENISTIVLADGEYEGNFTVQYSQTLEAEEEDTVITGDSSITIDADYVTIDGLIFDDVDVSWTITVLNDADNAKILNCTFTNEGSDVNREIKVNNANGTVVKGNHFEGLNGNEIGGPWFTGTLGDITVLENTVINARGEGITVNQGGGDTADQEIVIKGNTVENATLEDVKVVNKPKSINGETDTLDMYDAVLDDNPGVNTVELSWLAVVDDNDGLNTALANDSIEFILVKDGTYDEGIGAGGRFVVQYSQVILADNEHQAVIDGGFQVDADDVLIEGFEIETEAWGINVQGDIADNVYIYNNTFNCPLEGAAGGMMAIHFDNQTPGGEVADNIIHDVRKGIGFLRTAKSELLITGNSIQSLTEEALEFTGADEAQNIVISDNVVKNVGFPCITGEVGHFVETFIDENDFDCLPEITVENAEAFKIALDTPYYMTIIFGDDIEYTAPDEDVSFALKRDNLVLDGDGYALNYAEIGGGNSVIEAIGNDVVVKNLTLANQSPDKQPFDLHAIGKRVVFEDNTISRGEEQGNPAIIIGPDALDTIVRDNVIDYGAIAADTHRCTIMDNTMEWVVSEGIWMHPTPYEADQAKARANELYYENIINDWGNEPNVEAAVKVLDYYGVWHYSDH